MNVITANTIYDIHGQHRMVVDQNDQVLSAIDRDGYSVDSKEYTIPKVWLYSGIILGYIIGAVLFIPIVITLLAISAIKGVSIKELIARNIALPSQLYNKEFLDYTKDTLLKLVPNDLRVNMLPLYNCKGEALDAVTLQNNGGNKKWIVVMTGRLGAYEYNIDRYGEYAKRMGVGILAFNWKGVGHSEGRTREANDMIEDGKLAIEYLMGMGVAAEDICVYGHSLGGGIGAQVVKYYQDRGDVLGFVSDRSFADATDVVETLLSCFPGVKEGISLLTRFWWNLNAIDIFPHLMGFKGVIYSKEDIIIPYENSSLYSRVKQAYGKPDYRLKVRDGDGISAHVKPIPPEVLQVFMEPWLNSTFV